MDQGSEQPKPRREIGGRNVSIDGGIFHRQGVPPVVVDSSKDGIQPVIREIADYTNVTNLNLFVSRAQKWIPIDPNWEMAKSQQFKQYNGRKVDLGIYLTDGKEFDNPIPKPGAGPDDQALLLALMLELKIQNKNAGLKKQISNLISGKLPSEVSILKDKIDGHASVYYQTEKSIYRYDPTSGDKKFVSISPPVNPA